MDIGNENGPELKLEQILEKKVEVLLLCCSIGAVTVYFIALLVLRLVAVLLLRKKQKRKIYLCQCLIIAKSWSLSLWQTVYLI